MDLYRLADEAIDLFAPLAESFRSPQALSELLARLGILRDPATLTTAIGALAPIVSQIDALPNHRGAHVDPTQQALGVITAVAGIQRALPDALRTIGNLPSTALEELAATLLINKIVRDHPLLFDALLLLGVIRREDLPASGPGGRDLDFVPFRIEWARLGKSLTDPAGLLREVYGWGTASFDAQLLVLRLARLADSAGLIVRTDSVDGLLGAALATTRLGEPAWMARLAIVEESVSGVVCRVGVALMPALGSTATDDGLALTPIVEGSVGAAIPLTDELSLAVEASAALAGGIVATVRPQSGLNLRVGVLDGNTGIAAAGAVALQWAPGSEATVLGSATGTRLAASGAALRLRVVPNDVELQASLSNAAIVIKPTEGDGFLARVLPAGPLRIPFSALLRWSHRQGLQFEGGAGFELSKSTALSFGPLFVDAVHLKVGADAQGLRAHGAISAGLSIGPLTARIDQVGVRFILEFGKRGLLGFADASLGFKPPAGVGLKLAAGPAQGSGFLLLDPDAGQYAGAIQLSVKAIDLSALGLINTKLPDGRSGFSFLILITAQFPPVPLPFGFALTGVGGLLGIHRRMDVEALKLKVSEGVLESILFPRDPVGRIQTVLADLRTIFPIQEGRHVFGPMVKMTWGPSALLAMDLAVILDIPSPLRLAILGRMRLVLPTATDPIADIRLEVAGIIDFDRQEASVAASLIDSRLAGFTLTGDMAMFLGWGATKAFALSMGGFFPGFTPPAGMPARMRRLAIGLTSGENPRLRLESYFAVTSNTLQFGARADLYAAVDTFAGTFAATGMASFDALIQFEPFAFLAQLRALLSILRNGAPVLSAELQATLSGPGAWHAQGFVAFEILVKVRIPFDVTVGEAAQVPPPTVNLFDMLMAEVARKESWASAPPPSAGAIATLRDAEPGQGIVLHPLASVTLLQRQMPFEKVLNRFGAARPDGPPPRFSLEAIGVGSAASRPTAALADFAPGQFDDLSEDEKLSRPAFEAMPAGGSAILRAFRVPSSRSSAPGPSAGQADWPDGFQNIVLGTTPMVSTPGSGFALPFPKDSSIDEALRMSGSGVRVLPETFALADADTLEAQSADALVGSVAQAHDRWRSLSPSGRDRFVVAPAVDTWTAP